MKPTKRLLQLFRDNAGVASNFKIAAADNEATVYLYDAIGGFWGIEAEAAVKEINGITAGTIHLRINSPGGDVFDARAIQTALKQHKAKVIVHIDGLAASAATFVAMAGDEIEMAEGAFLMIHKAWALQIGNSEDMLQMADLLDKVDDTLVADYQKKTGLPADDIRTWMEAETWFNAQEALDNGFIDRIFEGEAAENSFRLDAYEHTPDSLKHEIRKEEDDANAAAERHRQHLERRLALIDRNI